MILKFASATPNVDELIPGPWSNYAIRSPDFTKSWPVTFIIWNPSRYFKLLWQLESRWNSDKFIGRKNTSRALFEVSHPRVLPWSINLYWMEDINCSLERWLVRCTSLCHSVLHRWLQQSSGQLQLPRRLSLKTLWRGRLRDIIWVDAYSLAKWYFVWLGSISYDNRDLRALSYTTNQKLTWTH